MQKPKSTIPAPARPGFLQPVLPDTAQTQVHWGRLYGSSLGLLIANARQQFPGLILVVTADMQQATRLEHALDFYLSEGHSGLLAFPDWETLPYDLFSPHQDIISQRLETLSRLPDLHGGILIVPANTLMQRLPPREYVLGHTLALQHGDTLPPETLRNRLEQAGYRYVSQVMEHGEYAVRGSLLDLFPMGSDQPYRIDWFDREIESIRSFDPETQRSTGTHDAIRILPAHEFPLHAEAISEFRQAYRKRFEGDPQKSLVYTEVSQGNAIGGIEYYLPLFFQQTSTLFDYLPQDTLTLRLDPMQPAIDKFWEQIAGRYESRRHDQERPLLAPEEIYLDPQQLAQRLDAFHTVHAQFFEFTEDADTRSHINFATAAPPPLLIQTHAQEPCQALQKYLQDYPGRILLAAETSGRREVLLEILRKIAVFPHPVVGWQEFLQARDKICICVAPLEEGLVIREPALSLIAESQLFGSRAVQQRRRKRSQLSNTEQIVRNLTDLHMDAPVVHEEHGVGRYRGLQKIRVGKHDTEFLVLEYAEGTKLYVPVASLHLISRYTGSSPDSAPLHRLGSDHWQKVKKRAAERARDVAAELLDIYARRAARQGFAYPYDEGEYHRFADAFPFEETPDQQGAIDAVIADMRAAQPMDRVVCGDVGFGKTEVAMRAAFLAVQGGKQVAVLVPTTLLAQQHYQNFQDRFADWPIRIETLSRFKTGAEQQDILHRIANGRVDVVVGTHKILQKEIRFRNLGLVIIDEEHRFGVRQKELLKSLRSEVDILTLTATPIPRTLNMALSGLRDLSIIATAPTERVAIKTFISEWDDNLILEAFLRELKRGGQIYFLHNEVSSIEKMARQLQALVPEAGIRIAHGQMRERDLEQVMLDFYHQRFNVLVCTTIIESGIDVPTANTIIIHRADKLGLAQLHQIRGRVGRSHHRAYAYLLIPHRKSLTQDAVKRLEAIESLEDLGAGFMLATHDLEIRGAGELLGEGQSGQIQEIGFTLYTELLERAVQALKAGHEPDLDRPLHHGPEIDLHLPALIPEDYLPDVHTRLILYKRIASAATQAELDELQVEMIDRFGLLPDAAKNLVRITELKNMAHAMGIEKIDAGEQGGRILFGPAPQVDSVGIIQMIQKQPQEFRLDGQHKLRFIVELTDEKARMDYVFQLLGRIRPNRQQASA